MAFLDEMSEEIGGALADACGEAATYRAPGSSELVPCTLILNRGGLQVRQTDQRRTLTTQPIGRVRDTEVPAPLPGGQFVVAEHPGEAAVIFRVGRVIGKRGGWWQMALTQS